MVSHLDNREPKDQKLYEMGECRTMKYKIVLLIIAVSLAISLCACSKENADLVDMTFGTGDGYVTIIWGDKTYVPYGVISRSDCG